MPGHDSTRGAKQWLLLHLEKPLFFLAILLLGLLVYGAIGKLQPQIGESPEELTKRAAQLKTRIDRSTWDENAYLVPDFSTMIQMARRPVGLEDYSFESLVGPTANTSDKRTRPEFLAAETPWAVAGNGIFWVKGERPGGEEALDDDEQNAYPSNLYRGVGAPADAIGEVRRWVSITAVVPVSKQQAIYDRHFINADGYNQGRDLPKYLLARIQRSEVSPGDTEEMLDWDEPDPWSPNTSQQQVALAETAEGRLFPEEHERWAATAPEVVDPKFVHAQLTTPLGPLAYQHWNRWATHPRIPLKAVVPEPPPQAKQPPRGRRARGPQRGNTPGLFSPDVPGAGNRPPSEQSRRRNRVFADEKPSEDPAKKTPVKTSTEDKVPSVAAENTMLLVRLFDFDVEAGKTYRYRVQLLLENPNYEQPARFLKNPGDRKSRVTPDAWLEWSAPTAPVRVPRDTRVYIEGLASDEEATAEEDQRSAADKANLVVQTLDPVTGEVVTGRDAFVRGNVVVLDEAADKLREKGLASDLVVEQTPLKTDLVLLDMYSGHAAQGKAPAEMLFLDSQGNIFWRDSVSDLAVTGQFNRLQQYLETAEAQNAKGKAATVRGEDAARKELTDDDDKDKKKKKGRKRPKK